MTTIADEIEAGADAFADALLTAPDPTAKAGTLEWTVHEVGAHVARGSELYAGMVTGEEAPRSLADIGKLAPQFIAAEVDTPDSELADRVRAGSQALAAAVRKAGDDPVPFYEHDLPASIVGGLFLGELLVHGYDIGIRAMPTDAAAHAALSAAHILPFVLRPGAPARATLAFRARGHGDVVITVDEERARVSGPGPKVDARLSGEPVTLLLAVYQRIKPIGPMLRGRLAVTGRRPWRLKALQTRFQSA